MTHKRVLRALFGPDAETQPFRVRIALSLITALAYLLAFAPAHGLISRSAITLSILPIIVTSARFGWRGGVVAGLISVPLKVLLFVSVGEPDIGPFSGRDFLFSHIVFVVVGAVVGYLHDVRRQLQRELHERKLAENRLRELNASLEELVTARTAEIFAEKERSETILRSTADANAMFDLEMKPRYVNPAFTAMTGYTVEELRQGNVSFLDRPEQILQPQLSAKAEGEVWQDEITILRKDGRSYDAAMTVAPVRDAGDDVVGYVSSHQDISRLKELERARNRFITNVSHSLCTPVTTIKLYGHLLGLGRGPEKTAIYLEELKKQSEQLEHLIQDILEIAVLDAGKAAITRDPLWIFSVVDNVVTKRRAQADVAGLSLVPLPVSPELPEVKGD